jgi:putative ABC transport system permease protein
MLSTTLLLALREIRRHLLRTFLTVLGIVIGVFSVITIVTLGDGATAAIRTSISALGSDLLQVRPGQSAGPGAGTGEIAPPFDVADADAIREQIGGVVAVAPQAQVTATIVRNSQNWSTIVTGTTNEYFRAQKWRLAEGELFSAQDEQGGRRVCIVGQTVVRNLFQDGPAVGQSLRVQGVNCQVIGVLPTRGQGGFGNDQDDTVIMPLRAVHRQLTGNQDIRSIMVGIDPAFDSAAIQASLVRLLRERRSLEDHEDDDFSVIDAKQVSDTISGTVNTLKLLIGAVAAISLLVGGIGVMNIMLVSVTERTREIGIRLAIGALGKEVRTQFLVEAVVLSCLGGIIGIVLAFVACVLVAPMLGLPFLFNPAINVTSFLVSALTGVVFGYFPAQRAASLDPIDALRYE